MSPSTIPILIISESNVSLVISVKSCVNNQADAWADALRTEKEPLVLDLAELVFWSISFNS